MLRRRLHAKRVFTLASALLAAYIVVSYLAKSYTDRHVQAIDEGTVLRMVQEEQDADNYRDMDFRMEGEDLEELWEEEDDVVANPEKPRIHDMNEMMKQVFRGENVPDDMMAMEPPRYLQNFKNPCWFEKNTDPAAAAKKNNPSIDGVQVKIRCLPYFHLIGMDKSGTTDLWARLARHPQMVRPHAVMGKETHWWSWRRFGFDIWTRNAPIRHFDWYLQHFDEPAEKILSETVIKNNQTYHPLITGEGSPTVFWDFTGWDLLPQNKGKDPEDAVTTPHCIHHFTPKAKLILMLRNPVERLYSEYLFLDRFKAVHNVSAQLFHEAVTQAIAMYENCIKVHSHRACLYNKTLHIHLPVRVLGGMYSEWLETWLEVFPISQMLIIRNEDYAKDAAHTLRTVIDFLGLSKLSDEEMAKILEMDRTFGRSDKDKAVGDMLPATRAILQDFYSDFNMKLTEMLGDVDFSGQELGFLWDDE